MKLMKHQQKAVDIFNHTDSLALLWDMGTGKTAAAIRMTETHNSILILSPLITLQNWREEFKSWGKFREDLITIPKGTGAKRVNNLKEALSKSTERVVILNYEALLSDPLFNALKKWKPSVVICDESHVIKTHTAKRSRRAVTLGDLAEKRIILTGTPYTNSLMDFWNQYRFLDGGETLGKSFFGFRNKYFHDANAYRSRQPGYYPDFQPRPDTFNRLNALIKSKSIRVEKHECLDLPELVTPPPYPVVMSADQKSLYDQMRKLYIAEISDLKTQQTHKVVASIALTKALRLQQIVSGFYKTETGEEIAFKNCPRIKATEELVQGIPSNAKFIIWCNFRKNYEMLEEMLNKNGIVYRKIIGGDSQTDRAQAIRDFQENSSVRAMIANPKAGGVGVNLTSASYSIVYSRGFSLTDELQALHRNYRKGSEIHDKITRLELCSYGTIDQLVVESIHEKKSISDRILDFKHLNE